jgi:hypothetical protein
MRRALFIPAIVLVLVAGCGAARALDKAKVDAVTLAADQFVIMAQGSHRSGHPPRQTDPAAKVLIDPVFDVREVQQSYRSYKMSDLGILNTWNLAVLKVGLVYILAGTGVDDLGKLQVTDAIIKKIDQNTVDFAPELGRYYDAQVWIQIGIMELLNGYLPTAPRAQLEQPTFKTGVAQVRAGSAQTLNGFVTTFPNAGLSDEWRRARLAVLATAGPTAVKFLLPEQSAALREATLKVAAHMNDPTVKAGLTAFADSLTRH